MTNKEKQTEERIAEAAREVFIEKGMAGARMQEIADKAGINKSLLHYYFRSKEKLFDYIFSKIIGLIGNMFSEIMIEGITIENKMKMLVNTYIDTLLKNPFLPNFIFNEITRNPKGILKRFEAAKINPQELFIPLEKQLKAEGYNIDKRDFVLNIISMVVFPIAAKPIVNNLLFNDDSKAYKAYILNRKKSIVTFVMAALQAYK